MFSRLKCKQRRREQERIMFARFVEYCSRKNKDDEDLDLLRMQVFDEALATFEKKDEYLRLCQMEKRRLEVHDKFNGKLIMEWTTLTGVQLGNFMKQFKETYSEEQLYEMDKEFIKEKVLQMADYFTQDQKDAGASL